MSDIRVLVIASDPLARAGLAALLSEQPGLAVVARVAGDASLSSDLDLYKADVGVWDLGWEALSEDSSTRFDPASIAETVEAGVSLVVLIPGSELAAPLWGAGVRSILMRDSTPEQIGTAVNALVNRLAALDLSLADQIASPTFQPGALPADGLTPRELEVLRHIAEGSSNKAIAHALSISEHTVNFHINSLMSKLNAQSRTEAVVRATRLGLISL